MYRIPHINFVSFKFTAEQARKKVMDFAFFLYLPVLIVLIVLNSAVVPSMAAFAAYLNSQGNWVDQISKFWGRLNLALSGVSLSVSGDEFIEKNQPYIVMANHQSNYDVFALIGISAPASEMGYEDGTQKDTHIRDCLREGRTHLC